jgi:hypothetical protein
MTAAARQQPQDLLGIDNPEQYKDRQGTPEPKSPFVSDDEHVARTESELSANDASFAPNKVYYIQGHFMASKQIVIVDITGQVPVNFVDGKNVSDEFREAAKKVGTAKDAVPAFVFKKKHWYNKSYQAFRGEDTSTPLGEWKHPTWSTGTATINFPVGSKHCSHNLAIAPLKWTRRTNEFVVESVPHLWSFDAKYKSHRMTLAKRIGGVDTTIARYSQKLMAW